MNSLGSLVTVVVAGVVAMVGAGALIARRLNGHSGCPIPEHVALLAEHSKAIEIIQRDLAEIKKTLGEVRDTVLKLNGKE